MDLSIVFVLTLVTLRKCDVCVTSLFSNNGRQHIMWPSKATPCTIKQGQRKP